MKALLLGVLAALACAAPADAAFSDSQWRGPYPVLVERCDFVFDAYGQSWAVCYIDRWCRTGTLKRPRHCRFEDPGGDVRRIR